MQLFSIGKDKFYNLVNCEDTQQPMSISEKLCSGIHIRLM